MSNARTYEVRTYGCQMNVHDSERLSGLLEDAGYVARGRRARRPTSWSSTPARSGRTPTTSSTATSATWRRSRPRTRACRSPSAAASRRRTAARSPGARRGSTSSSAPTTSARCRRCSSGPGSPSEAQVEILESLEVFPSTLPTRRESAYAAWVAVSVGCNNTCTFCIVPSLRGTEQDRRPGDVLAEVEALVAEGVIEVTLLGQNVNSYGVGFGDRFAFGKLLRACGEIDGLERVRFTSPHPRDFTDDVIAAMAETPNVMHQLHMPLQSGSDAGAEVDASVVPSRPLPRHPRPGPRRDARCRDHHRHHRRLPRRDRGRLPADPRRGPRGAVQRSVHVPLLQAARHSGRRHARPAAARGRPGALRAAGRASSTRSPGSENQTFEGREVEVLVAEGEGRKDRATERLSGRARDNRLVHFAPPTDGTVVRPGRHGDGDRHLRRAAPPGRRRAADARSGAPEPATPGRRAPRRRSPRPSRWGCRRSAYPRRCRQSTLRLPGLIRAASRPAPLSIELRPRRPSNGASMSLGGPSMSAGEREPVKAALAGAEQYAVLARRPRPPGAAPGAGRRGRLRPRRRRRRLHRSVDRADGQGARPRPPRRPARGASRSPGPRRGRNGGFCEASLTHGPANGLERFPDEFDTLERLGEENLAELRADRRAVRHRLPSSRPTGQLNVATEAYQVEWLREEAERGGGDFLDRDAVQAEVASPTYHAGLWSHDTVMVHPAKLAWGLAEAAERLGVEIYEHSHVVGDRQARRRPDRADHPQRPRRAPTGSRSAPTSFPSLVDACGPTSSRSTTTRSSPSR